MKQNLSIFSDEAHYTFCYLIDYKPNTLWPVWQSFGLQNRFGKPGTLG